jgi:hypothetical protein
MVFSAEQIVRAHRYGRDLIRPVKIETTLEYRVARWFGDHMPGARVMVPGSCEFWLASFTDSPQLGGGFAQGTSNQVIPVADYVVLNGVGTEADARLAILWLKAFGVQAIEAGGQTTREYYHAFRIGGKFRGALEELWREGDDTIYRVPQRTNSLAHVMSEGQLVSRTPYNGLDTEQLERFVAALDDPTLPAAQLHWSRLHAVEIETQARRGQVVEVQMSYDPGWKASANGHEAKVREDGLGLISIDPRCDGRCHINLEFMADGEARWARWASGLTIACFGLYWALDWRRVSQHTPGV